jgi:hypothetical protein
LSDASDYLLQPARVAMHMPQVDTAKASRRLGWRQPPWRIVA